MGDGQGGPEGHIKAGLSELQSSRARARESGLDLIDVPRGSGLSRAACHLADPWSITVADLRQAFQPADLESNGGKHKEDHMRTILKYRLDVRQPELKLPAGSIVRHVAHEPGNPVHIVTLWADCPDVPTLDAAPNPDGCRFHDQWQIAVFGTGHSITGLEPSVGFLGTAVCIDHLGGQLVWHVFGRPRV